MNIEDLRKICLAHKGTSEDIKWGNDLCFFVLGKMYCVACIDVLLKMPLKVNNDEFDEISKQVGIIATPYMARNKWVLVTDPSVFNKKEWIGRIATSYELVKARLSKKALKEAGL